MIRGPVGPGASDAQVQAQVQTGVKAYARTGGPLVPDGEIAASIARDSEITAAVANLRDGVKAAYDTLKELADKVVTGVAVRSGRIVLIHDDGTVTDADATGLARTDAYINNLINRVIQDAGGFGVTLAQVLAAIRAGSNITINRGIAGQITINAIGGSSGPVQSQHVRAGWSADQLISDAELTVASTPAAPGTVRLDTNLSGLNYLALWRSDDDGGDPTEVHLAGGGNSRNLFGAAANYTYQGVAGKLIVSAARQNADLLGGENARLV